MQAFARTLFINHGKTTAIIVNMSGDAYLADKEPEKLNPSPDDARRLPEGWVIASEEKFQRPIELRFTSRQVKDIETRTQTLYCAGHIRYKDILVTSGSLVIVGNGFQLKTVLTSVPEALLTIFVSSVDPRESRSCDSESPVLVAARQQEGFRVLQIQTLLMQEDKMAWHALSFLDSRSKSSRIASC